MFGDIGKLLVLIGLVLVATGLVLTLLPAFRLGRLPGDIVIRRENWSVYFPITTSVIISVFLSLLLWIISFFRRW